MAWHHTPGSSSKTSTPKVSTPKVSTPKVATPKPKVIPSPNGQLTMLPSKKGSAKPVHAKPAHHGGTHPAHHPASAHHVSSHHHHHGGGKHHSHVALHTTQTAPKKG